MLLEQTDEPHRRERRRADAHVLRAAVDECRLPLLIVPAAGFLLRQLLGHGGEVEPERGDYRVTGTPHDHPDGVAATADDGAGEEAVVGPDDHAPPAPCGELVRL